jgi:hypothetical protein
MPARLHGEFERYMKLGYGKRILSRASMRLLFTVLERFETASIALSHGFSYIDLLQCLYADEPYVVIPTVFTRGEYSLLVEIRNTYGICQSDLLRLAMLSVLYPEGSTVLPLTGFVTHFYRDTRSCRLNFQLYNEVIDLFNDTAITDLHIQKIPLFRSSGYYFSRVKGDIDVFVDACLPRFTVSTRSWDVPVTQSCQAFYRVLKVKTGLTGTMLFNLSLYHFLRDIKDGVVYG